MLQDIADWLQVYIKKITTKPLSFSVGFDKSAVPKTVRYVTVAKAGHFIGWPVSSDARTAIKTGFYAQARFLNVIRCIDGTHVWILAPSRECLRESKGLPQHQCANYL